MMLDWSRRLKELATGGEEESGSKDRANVRRNVEVATGMRGSVWRYLGAEGVLSPFLMLAVVWDGYSQWNASEAQRHATNGGRPTWREVARPEATGPWKSKATSGHETEIKAICTCETMEHQGVASLFVQIAPAMQLYKFQGGSGCSQNVVACDVPSNMQT
uniref:Uncharacterized protein n=1 Tax=Oryza barthii TaxID=65489 RepID=A0A0D3FKI6_9ORYZ